MLYTLLKIIVRVSLRVFFKHLKVKHLERMPSTGPLIVVANHPNTFMDPIAIACMMKQQVHFLTNGSMFNAPWKRWLLRQMNMVPIYRKQDVQEGEQPDNEAVFQACYAFLKAGGTLMIFPEGSSIKERRLRPLKTGTARIALGAEKFHDFSLGVQLISVGLNYSASNRFRSELLIEVDEPIQANDWQDAYTHDEQTAVKDLTATLTDRLASHTIVTRHEYEDQLAQDIATIYEGSEADYPADWVKGEEHYQMSKHVVNALHYFEQIQPERVTQLATRVAQYSNSLRRLHLKSSLLDNHPNKSVFYNALKELFFLLIGLPFYIFGLAHHYLPYLIPSKIAQGITKEIEYHAPMMMVVGIVLFPLFYTLYFLGLSMLQPHWWIYALYALLLPVSGFFCLYYWSKWLEARQQLWLFSLFYKRSTLVAQLLRLREQLIKDLNQARNEYVDSLD